MWYYLQISSRLKSAVQALGTGCVELVKDCGNLQSNPTDGFAKRDLAEHVRLVTAKVSSKVTK